MAKKIKETPILYGKDAERFLENMANPKKISPEELQRILDGYHKIASAGHRDSEDNSNALLKGAYEFVCKENRDNQEIIKGLEESIVRKRNSILALFDRSQELKQTIAQQEQQIAELQAQVKMWIEECDAKREECIALTEQLKKG